MCMHLREACLLFVSAIAKSSLYVRQNDKAHAHQITLLSLAPWEPFSSLYRVAILDIPFNTNVFTHLDLHALILV